MPVPPIGSLNLSMIDGADAAGAAGTTSPAGGAGAFGDVLRTKLESLSNSQDVGLQATKDLASGSSVDVAQTMMRVEQANVSLQLATQVRNKAIEAYQEILRMQV